MTSDYYILMIEILIFLIPLVSFYFGVLSFFRYEKSKSTKDLIFGLFSSLIFVGSIIYYIYYNSFLKFVHRDDFYYLYSYSSDVAFSYRFEAANLMVFFMNVITPLLFLILGILCIIRYTKTKNKKDLILGLIFSFICIGIILIIIFLFFRAQTMMVYGPIGKM